MDNTIWEIPTFENNNTSDISKYYFDPPIPPTTYHYPYYNYFTYTTPATIYKYQIQCPSCDTMNWLELDTLTVCTKTKCRAKLKAVAQKVDHEIEINL